jgi:TPR repeat protein|tara:strand:- start:93 stop:695 length:603 start_codon:yes stop_codon:yes gene_type:complete
MNHLYSLVLAIILLVGGVSVATAQDYDKGLEAAQAGDFQTALQEWRPLAEQGNSDAQKDLGVMYYTGQGVSQDYAEAVKWYRLAAEQGNADAQSNLAEMYYKGQGILLDYDEAAKWLQLVAKDGSAPAQHNLALMYEAGNGVLQSNVMAHMWYNIASANGHSKSGEWRDETAGLMTQADISKAQQMASECMSSNYQSCGY